MPTAHKKNRGRFKVGQDKRRKIPAIQWTKEGKQTIYHRPDASRASQESLNPQAVPILKENVAKMKDPPNVTVLREKPGDPTIFEAYMQPEIQGNKFTYRFLHANMTCKLFTDAFHGHSEQFPDCKGNF